MPLISDAGPALTGCGIRVLYRDRAPRNQCVLAIVDGMCPCIGQSEVESVCHATPERDCHAVINARRRSVELVDRPQLRDRPLNIINTGREWTTERLLRLQCSERLYGIKRVGKCIAGRI